MPGAHGKNTKVYVEGYNLTPYLDSFDSNWSRNTVETTVFSDGDETHVVGINGARFAGEGFCDGYASTTIDKVLNDALGSSNQNEVSYYPNTDSVGKYGYGFVADESEYAVKSSISGAVRVAFAGQSNIGREKLVSLHPLSTETSSGNESNHDNGSASTNGGSAFLHVTNNASSAFQALVEHSSDGSSWETLVSFTACTSGPTSERKTFSDTARRYIRGSWLTSASAEFQVGYHRD